MSSDEEHPLSVALGKVDPEDLSKTRDSVRKEIAKSKVPDAPESEPDDEESEEQDEGVMDEDGDEAEEDEAEEEAPESDDKFVVDLNNLADMLVLLVGRYQRATKLLIASVVLLVICIALVVKAGFEINYLQEGQYALQREVTKAKDEMAKATEEAKKTTEAVRKTTEAVKATREEVKEVKETVPKVEVDERTGVAQVVVPKTKKGDGDKVGPKEPKSDKPQPPPPSPAPPSSDTDTKAPLNPQVGLK